MAYKVTNEVFCHFTGEYRKEIICDTEADISSLPACCPWSTCLVAATGNVYIVNASGNWVKMGG